MGDLWGDGGHGGGGEGTIGGTGGQENGGADTGFKKDWSTHCKTNLSFEVLRSMI